MEKSTLVSVTCPACDKEGELLKHEIIDITKNPALRSEIVNRQIFTYTCPHCGEKIAVSYDCIYIDTENKHCIALITTDDFSFVDKISAKDYDVRVVGSINDFIEKIALFEDGIDDRVCELCKLFLGESYEEQNNAELLAAYYSGRDMENDNLHFYLIGDDAGNCETTLSMQSYRNILEVFSASPFNNKEETRIDAEWALLALRDGIFDVETDV
ncbi:MAG: CpXC domain-containing protein [Clostridia bacterium]|nr:CpXC domain-containing protein [Clostridia bacterium]MBQ6895342.1 CpXC domain-containing protein [Clostridia bacterium]